MNLTVNERNEPLADFLGLNRTRVTESLVAEPMIMNAFRPLEELLALPASDTGPVEVKAHNFMYMGQKRQGDIVVALYKHTFTRRYLNIDPLSLETYQYDSFDNRFKRITLKLAIAWVQS